MTLKEIYYAIISHIENGLPNQGNTYWKKQIYADIHNWRAIMIHRSFESKLRVNNVTQSLQCQLTDYTTHTIEAKSLILDEIVAKNNASIYVSTIQIPNRIQIKGQHELNYVGSDLFSAIDIVTIPALRYTTYEKWTGHKPKVTILNNYIYLILTNNDSTNMAQDAISDSIVSMDSVEEKPETLTIRAIFANPLQSPLTLTENDSYPLPEDMTQQLIESLIKKYEVQRNRPQDQSGLQIQENI